MEHSIVYWFNDQIIVILWFLVTTILLNKMNRLLKTFDTLQ